MKFVCLLDKNEHFKINNKTKLRFIFVALQKGAY